MRSVFFYKRSETTGRPTSRARWLVNVWLPVLLAIGVIAIESTNLFSSKNTSGWLRTFAEHLFGPIRDQVWEPFHHYLRKTGHFVGYGTVCLTFLRAWLHTIGDRRPNSLLVWRLESCALAIFSTAIVASGDEAHQAFLADRTGTPADVLLDTLGGATLCLLVWLICWVGRSSEESF